LGLASGKRMKPSANFNQIVANQRLSADAAPLAAALATLPKFLAHRDYVAADAPINLAKGDLNGDGIADLVVPNFNSTNVSVLLGKNDGSFQTVRLFNSGGVQPFEAVIADFNGDGKNDVVETFPTAGLAILRGDGLGHLGTPALLAAGAHPLHIVSVDFNGDHKADLAVTNSDSNNVSILLGKGDGTFTVAPSPAVGMAPVGIVVGDFNGDGKADLAVADSGVPSGNNAGTHPNTVAILLGTGTGRFQAPAFVPVARTPLLLAVADFNKTTVRTWL
jgi:FG-GAP-like repeat